MASDNMRNNNDLNFVVTLDGNRVEESPLHRGNFLEPSRSPMQTVRNLNGIASMKLPDNWFKVEQNSQLSDATTFRPSTVDKTQITLYGNRQPLDEQSNEAFKQVIHADLPTPRIIYSEKMQADNEKNAQTIKDLSGALGRTLVGDNQMTSSTSRTPAFHMDTATVETINGKKVIAVDGWFTQMDDFAAIKMDENGPLKRRYSGVFYEADTAEGTKPKIKEMYLLADDNISFTSNKAAFRTAVQSIKWK